MSVSRIHTCQCGRKYTTATTENSYFREFCTHYCWIYFQNPEAYPEYELSSVSGCKHHNGHWKKPPIEVECENCSKKFHLRHSMNGGNRIFCSHACSVQIAKKKKNAMRDFSLLKLLKTYGELSIYELVAKWPNDKKMITTSVPTHTFRCAGYFRRNIVLVREVNGIKMFRLHPEIMEKNIPIGKLICTKQPYPHETLM